MTVFSAILSNHNDLARLKFDVGGQANRDYSLMFEAIATTLENLDDVVIYASLINGRKIRLGWDHMEHRSTVFRGVEVAEIKFQDLLHKIQLQWQVS